MREIKEFIKRYLNLLSIIYFCFAVYGALFNPVHRPHAVIGLLLASIFPRIWAMERISK